MKPVFVYVTLALTTFFWGAVFHVGRFAVTLVSPPTVSAWRFLLASIVLVPFVWYRERLPWRALARNALPLLAMAAIGVFGFNMSTFYGLRSTSAVNAALIMALNPAMTTILAAIVGREAVTARQLAGLLLGIAGVGVVISKGDWSVIAGLSFSHGDLLILLASLCWAWYPVILRRYVHGMSVMQVTAATLLAGALMMAAFAGHASTDLVAMPSLPVAAGVVFMGLFGTALAYLWWNRGVQTLGAPGAAVFINLVPLSTAAIGVALGEPLSWSQVTGACLVISGVLTASAPLALLHHAAAPSPSLRGTN